MEIKYFIKEKNGNVKNSLKTALLTQKFRKKFKTWVTQEQRKKNKIAHHQLALTRDVSTPGNV